MPVHIGEMIKKKAEEKKLSLEDLGKLINRTRQTVSDIYKRKTIDTDLLVNISAALSFDFLSLYYLDEPLKSMRSKELAPYRHEIEDLKKRLSQKEEKIKDLENTISSNSKVIHLLEEERAQYRKRK
jgi:transcriptional regulator with XRE-family HTH domain